MEDEAMVNQYITKFANKYMSERNTEREISI